MEKEDENKALKAFIIYCIICLFIVFILPGLILSILGWQKFD